MRLCRVPTFARRCVLIIIIGALPGVVAAGSGAAPAGDPAPASEAAVERWLLPNADIERLKSMGPSILPAMARIYERSSVEKRASIANVFYVLGWKSPDAKRVLMQDAHTSDANLRLQVQWALGRVSNDADVVDVLLANMQHDGNPLFRDKAACALAHDQIHLTEGQKVYLYSRLIEALRDPKPQVRDIALKVLVIHTGQNKGFDPNAPAAQREERVRAWEDWIDEYRANQ